MLFAIDGTVAVTKKYNYTIVTEISIKSMWLLESFSSMHFYVKLLFIKSFHNVK